jgi:hypothetical protein
MLPDESRANAKSTEVVQPDPAKSTRLASERYDWAFRDVRAECRCYLLSQYPPILSTFANNAFPLNFFRTRPEP